MIRRSVPLLACGLAVVSVSIGVVFAGSVPDRLDRFRTLAAARLGMAQLTDEGSSMATYRELYALLDEEIVESLGSGGVFASTEFLQDRLDAFGDAWGAMTVQIMRSGPLLVGAFQLSDVPNSTSVRVYGPLRDEPALLAAFSREGGPSLHPLPPAAGGTPQFAVAWEGQPSGRGTRGLRIDQLRQQGDTVRAVWSTAEVFPDGLFARDYRIRNTEIRVRYELRYPGWTPGCEGQTEQEDVFRLAPGASTFTRVGRRLHNGWHQEFRRAVAWLFAALSAGDRAALSGLVPDAGVRDLLPAALRAEPACDAADGTNPETVSVAAAAQHSPWQLTFQRAGVRWRLVRATPVRP